MGLSDFRKEKPWRPPSLLLEADPPAHTRVRRVTNRVLTPRALEDLRDGFDQYARALVAGLAGGAEIEAVSRLAQAYPLKVFPDAVGVGPDGRENLLLYGDMVFNAFGPRNALFESAMRAAAPVQSWIAERCRRESLSPGGLGAQVYDPRQWTEPDRFDIRRHPVNHVSFGSGAHACVGAAIARLEAEALLTGLARDVRTMELAGTVRPRLNNTVKGLAALPLKLG